MVALRSKKTWSAFAAFAVVVVASACASTPQTTPKQERLCTPDAWVYCRCQDRNDGSKQCNEDGTRFGPCLPCESSTNPVIEDPEPIPWEEPDSGMPDPADCGDGVVQFGEACDDGNADDGDGCNTKCQLSGSDPPATRSCPGMPVHVWGSAVEYVGTTKGAPLSYYPDTCSGEGGGNPTRALLGPERIFSVTTHRSGVLVVTTADTAFNSVIFAAQPCKIGTAQAPSPILTCANRFNDLQGERLELPVQAGQTYAVIVDSTNPSGDLGSVEGGVFKVTFAMK